MIEGVNRFIKWNNTSILHRVPVEVSYPNEFIERTSTLDTYLTTDKWPNKVMSEEAKRGVKEAAYELLPRLSAELTRAVRYMMVASATPDRATISNLGKTALKTYIEAKVFATMRVLIAVWLTGEGLPAWREQFVLLDTVWSNGVIYGLTSVLHNTFDPAFWTDADLLDIGKYKIRVFLPQNVGSEKLELRRLTQQDWCNILIPQILDTNHELVYGISPLLGGWSAEQVLDNISFRGEMTIESESHNFPIGNGEAKERARRIVAERVSRTLYGLPSEERRKKYIELMSGARVLGNMRNKILEVAPWTGAGHLICCTGTDITAVPPGQDRNPAANAKRAIAEDAASHPQVASFLLEHPVPQLFGLVDAVVARLSIRAHLLGHQL
jgi:hypothetical protein